MYNFEQIGFIPRSIVRTLKRFIKQISLKTDLFVIYEFRISRYIAIASIQCFFFLIICPWIFQILMKFLLINVFFQYRMIAKVIPRDIFINFHQQERAFSQIQTFSQKVYFETLFESFKIDKLGHEAKDLPLCNTFASACHPAASLQHNFAMPIAPLRLASARRSPLHDERAIYYNQKKNISTYFDRRFHLSDDAFKSQLVHAVDQLPDGLHWKENVGSVRYREATFWPEGRPEVHRKERDKNGPEQILNKYFRFQTPTTRILALPNEEPEGRRSVSPVPKQKPIYEVYQTYFLKCAYFYNQQSITIIINWILDLTTLLFFLFLLIFSTPQILILKTFFIESLLSLSETTKCFFLIFFLDLLVGFHSSKSWEIFLQFLIEHFGFQIHQNFIFFFISTFPVLLDTIFKYWIFRYLNKISPSTVATYQAMIE